MFVEPLLRYATRLVINLLAVVGYATKPGQIWQGTSVSPIDARSGLGLEGYDVVSYFTAGRPEKGSPRLICRTMTFPFRPHHNRRLKQAKNQLSISACSGDAASYCSAWRFARYSPAR